MVTQGLYLSFLKCLRESKGTIDPLRKVTIGKTRKLSKVFIKICKNLIIFTKKNETDLLASTLLLCLGSLATLSPKHPSRRDHVHSAASLFASLRPMGMTLLGSGKEKQKFPYGGALFSRDYNTIIVFRMRQTHGMPETIKPLFLHCSDYCSRAKWLNINSLGGVGDNRDNFRAKLSIRRRPFAYVYTTPVYPYSISMLQ